MNPPLPCKMVWFDVCNGAALLLFRWGMSNEFDKYASNLYKA